MRIPLKALLICGFGALLGLAAIPGSLASDAPTSRAARTHVIHHRGLAVRDYDGTPIRLGRQTVVRPVPLSGAGGLAVVEDSCRTYPVPVRVLPRQAYISEGRVSQARCATTRVARVVTRGIRIIPTGLRPGADLEERARMLR
jgi:hypothetical protein